MLGYGRPMRHYGAHTLMQTCLDTQLQLAPHRTKDKGDKKGENKGVREEVALHTHTHTHTHTRTRTRTETVLMMLMLNVGLVTITLNPNGMTFGGMSFPRQSVFGSTSHP